MRCFVTFFVQCLYFCNWKLLHLLFVWFYLCITLKTIYFQDFNPLSDGIQIQAVLMEQLDHFQVADTCISHVYTCLQCLNCQFITFHICNSEVCKSQNMGSWACQTQLDHSHVSSTDTFRNKDFNASPRQKKG